MTPIPNFFVAGAPKSGTTAMCAYLSRHSEFTLADPKEPCFWSRDVRPDTEYQTLEQYLEVFSDNTRVVCDGSTSTLWSERAVEQINEFNPNAKFLVMLRNPIELARSLHSEELAQFHEDEQEFDTAWEKQAARARGESIPKRCLAPEILQYGNICSNGFHLSRLLRVIPRNRIHVMLFEDFRDDPAGSYRSVLMFLGLQDEGLTEFPKLNESRVVKNRRIAAFVTSTPPLLVPIRNIARKIGLKNLRSSASKRLFERKLNRPPMSTAMQRQLGSFFDEDIQLLSCLIQRDLDHWRFV